MLPILAAALSLAFPALVLAAAFKDATSFTIPNGISLALVATFPAAALLAGVAPEILGLHAGVGVIALLVGMAIFAFGWIGGGDAKLLAAVSLWVGWPAVLTFLLATALTGGALAAILLMMRSAAVRPLALLGPRWVVALAEPGAGVPYGVAMAVGALAAFPLTPFATGLGL